MITCAANNYMRKYETVNTNEELIKNMTDKGFSKMDGEYECEACIDELEDSIQTKGWLGLVPPWGNPKTALKFKKGNKIVITCRCGWYKKHENNED